MVRGSASCSWGFSRGVMYGGNVNNGLVSGMSAVNANNAPSNTNWNYGASHSYGIMVSEEMPQPFRVTKVRKLGDKSTGK